MKKFKSWIITAALLLVILLTGALLGPTSWAGAIIMSVCFGILGALWTGLFGTIYDKLRGN